MSNIRPAVISDAGAIAEIYNYYVLNTVVTFEEEPVSVKEMAHRISMVSGVLPWLLCEKDDQILGYACASPWKSRSAYRFSAESTIYLHHLYTGAGIGTRLYSELIYILKNKYPMHTVSGGIALPNPGSIALHEKLGFKKVAHFNEVGWKFGTWIDVAYWQRHL